MKTCTKCGIEKKDCEFYLHKRGEAKREASCISCGQLAYHRYKKTKAYTRHLEKKREENKKTGYYKQRYKVWGRNYQLYKRFGITKLDYERMLEAQSGVCAICGCTETSLVNCSAKQKIIKSLSVDHNHETGQIRELLCDNCNTGIARFGENVEYMANAISYIEKHKVKKAEILTGT